MEDLNEKPLRKLLGRIIPRRVLFFDVEVTEHCNLQCKGCGSLAPLAEEEYLDLEEYEKDIQKLSEISDGIVHHISILGGEPLLHPKITDIMAMTRSYFPHGEINLVTNGILVDSMSMAFWNVLRDSQITLAPTKYPIKVDYDHIQRLAKERGVKFRFFGNPADTGFWNHLVLEPNGTRYETQSFMHCANANICAVLSHGKLFSCVRPAKIRHFNKAFNTDLCLTERDYLEVEKIKSLDEVMKFCATPLPFCRFCNTLAESPTNWEPSKKDISEWT